MHTSLPSNAGRVKSWDLKKLHNYVVFFIEKFESNIKLKFLVCNPGGADCTMIQSNKTWYLPNTVRDHARCIYAFNSYWKKTKKHGGTCYFKEAAVVTDLDPNTHHNSCHFESAA
ncbi:hypothetical protein PVAP13_9KG463580 [Panicum virgatum]|uniref:X8 domain-containing protein n=1 Tax=Panicum virgatum TaxID=38727 RepID=A0A8T0N9G8_PANVG|nr:hypothetical protein PVAP13_9KG463580 [Panicum virgatum]